MRIINYSVEEETDYGFMVNKREFVPRYFVEEVLREKIPRDIKKLLPDMELRELINASLTSVNLERVSISSVHIEPPIKDARKIICIALNYIDHVEEVGLKTPEEIVFFLKPPTALVGPFDSIVKPKIVEKLDYEGELAVIIGERAKNIEPSEAMYYIFGYTVFNDVTARDMQYRNGLWHGWMMSKCFDTFAPSGPWIVGREEIEDPHNLRIITRVDKEIRQNSSTSNMIFKIPEIISRISQIMTLEPGDIISTGTPAGVGYWREGGLLKEGDVVEVWIEKIGAIRNQVVSIKE
ncbi:MAG: fumarylacetoacetate hydrolase family protein [Aigarchaeota archaeon]|nr:fumarylacetoacetate hydrolase family protein [Aigarchaeota archaeon]MCX8193490.1 fumarylacetoacetate hydrolase family protein [Nitrososphaeria archaeon]MDW7986793.1 fumarylacetoacetate hydrolase family protein [Nitrososphaerota archaeon]